MSPLYKKTNVASTDWEKYHNSARELVLYFRCSLYFIKTKCGQINGSEIPALTEVVTLETDVSATNALNMALCLMSYVIALRHSQQ